MPENEQNYSHVSLYADRISPIIQTLLTDVIILGVFGVTFTYVGKHQPLSAEAWQDVSLWIRMFLLIWVILFASYNCLCYHIFIHGFTETDVNIRAGRFHPYAGAHTPRADSWRTALLFFIDLIQVTVTAFLFAGLLPEESEDFSIPARRWIVMFSLLAIWHLLLLLWYEVWGYHRRFADTLRGRFWSSNHFLFMLIYCVALTMIVLFLSGDDEAVAEGIFSLEASRNIMGVSVLLATIVVLYAIPLRHTFDEIHGEGRQSDKVSSDISATAFLVNESRARRLDVSQDRFAQDWIPIAMVGDVTALWDDYSKQVYPDDDIVVSLRNRVFLDMLRSATSGSPRHFVSFGAGFTSYPWLLGQQSLRSAIEVDLPGIIETKKSRMHELTAQRILPPRSVDFRAADLRNTDKQEMHSVMAEVEQRLTRQAQHRSVILMEGVSYYLTQESLAALFQWFAKVQTPGSLLGLDYWPADVVHNAAFKRQTQYFSERFGFRSDAYAFLEKQELENLEGYKPVEIIDVEALEARYCRARVLHERDAYIPEYVAILERI